MKVELQISETYEEEKLIVQAPQETEKVQKVIEFAENLDQREKIKGKIDDQVYLVEIGKIQRFYIENRKVLAETASQTYSIDLRLYQVLAETASQTYSIDLRLYQVLKLLPSNFIQISQSEIINIDSISHLKLTPNGLVEIFLKNESFTYSSRRYLKTIKEKLEL
ncbi:LytTR family DNA-binding domain-containing protein [Streptococcus pneumoniae]|nr:response regulator transcription factor [Streptococcus pneumoniae]HEU3551730.1 response regulator transcription factor [Streptococcus pneumoniae]